MTYAFKQRLGLEEDKEISWRRESVRVEDHEWINERPMYRYGWRVAFLNLDSGEIGWLPSDHKMKAGVFVFFAIRVTAITSTSS